MAPDAAISVVLGNYNQGAFLHDGIGSVLAQTHAPLEVIVVDDGSTDDSRAVIESYGRALRPTFKENGGQATTLSAGFAATRGDVVCFLDADDVWLPNKLERVAEVFAREPHALWLRHRLAIVDVERRPLGAVIPEFRGSGRRVPTRDRVIEGRLSVPTSALAMRRELALRVFPLPLEVAPGGRAPAVSLRHDADAILAARTAATRAPLFSLDEVLGEYRRHAGQVFAGLADLVRMLERQNQVALAASSCFAGAGRPPVVPSRVYKHAAVCAAAEGLPPWTGERLGPALRGVARCLRLLGSDPPLGLRQLAALTFAVAAPGAWTRKLMRANGFPETGLPWPPRPPKA